MSKRQNLYIFLHCEIVKYFDESGVFSLLQLCAEEYKMKQKVEKRPHPNFNLPIQIDLISLLDQYENLGMCLTKEPLMIKRIIREIIHISTKTFLEESQCDIQIGQVHSPLYIFNMPYCMENMKYSIGTRQTGMKFMKGVLASLGPRQEYIKQSAWQCCEDYEHPIIILPKIPYFAPKCNTCRSTTFEFQVSRNCGEMVKATFIATQAINIKNNTQEIGREVLIFDKMLNVLELGREYLITIVFSKKKVECWGIEPILAPEMSLVHLPINLRKIYYEDRHPWSLLFEMCWSLNDGITLSDAFIHLSMGLLLSIATIQAETSTPPVSVLALGTDTPIAAQLMKEAASLAQRSVFVNANSLYSAEYKKESEGCEANSILLSKTGVSVLGNWTIQSASQNNVFMIKSIMESNKIKISSEKSVPLKSSLWIYWDVTKSNKDQHQLATLINLFGISFQADCQQLESLADYMLINSIEPESKTEFRVSKDDMKDIYKFIANWPVAGDPVAEALLKDYFRTVRKDRSERVPLQTLKVLDALSKANARLNLRKTVTREDVLLIIYLHQHSQLVLFGDTGLCTPLIRNVKHLDEINEIAEEFDKWLNKYILALIGDTSSQYFVETQSSQTFYT